MWNGGSKGPLAIKLWSIVFGLKLAWELNIKKLCVESKSLEAISLIERGCDLQHPFSAIVKEIMDTLDHDWMVAFLHIFWECNNLANCLAWFTLKCLGSIYYIENPSNFYLAMVREKLCESFDFI